MSNQQSHPFVAPDEYERNKNTIAGYRAYLDMYERMNEQGLHNHAEFERAERMLQERVRQGEEAQRQLMFLKQEGARRITDGRKIIPEMNITASTGVATPIVQPAGETSSAYIEEVPDQRGSTNANQSNYVSHSAPKVPQPIRQFQQSLGPEGRHVSSPRQHVPTPSQFTAQPVANTAQHPKGYQLSSMKTQDYPRNPQAYTQPPPSRQTQPTLSPAQLEMYRQQHILPPRYFPSQQGSTATSSVSVQNQVPTRVDVQQGQGLQNLSSNGQIQQRPAETVTQGQPPSNILTRDEPFASASNEATSSLSGVLQPMQRKGDNSPDSLSIQTNTSIQQATSQETSHIPTTNHDSAVKSSLPEVQVHSSSPIVNAIPQATLVTQSTPPDNLPTSPIRTPKEADKKYLARDILRALKRPRPETSTIQGPEFKRHVSEATAVNPAIAMRSTPQAFSSPSLTAAQPKLPMSHQDSLAPTNSTVTLLPASTTWQTAATPTSYHTSTHTQSSTKGNGAFTVQNYSNFTGGQSFTRPKISQLTLFGQPHGPTPCAPMKASSLKFQNPDKVEVEPVARVLLQKDQPMRTSDQPSSVVQVGPQISSVVPSPTLLATGVPALSSVPASHNSLAPTVTVEEDGVGAGELPIGPSTDEVPGKTVLASLTNKTKTPLFLPSPTSSPHPGIIPGGTEEVAEIISAGEKDKRKTKVGVPSLSLSPSLRSTAMVTTKATNLAFVLVPPLPDYAKRWRKQGRSDVDSDTTGRGLGILSQSRSPSMGDYVGPPRSLSVSSIPPKVIDDEESKSDMAEELNWNSHFASYVDKAEKEVLLENSVVLRKTPCKWRNCELMLNSSGALIRHLDILHGPRQINATSSWTCRWIGCGYTCVARRDYRQHIERHAMYPLPCPYTGCNEVFRTARQLIRHKHNDHTNGLATRLTAEPSIVRRFPPSSIPPTMFKALPAYIIEYSSIQPASITRQRHEILMPSILRRISGNVPIQLHSYNAARPMPTTPSGKHVSDILPPANNPYSFLNNRSTRYSSYLSSPAKSRNFQELDSSYTTDLVKKGLVLWPEKEGDAVPDDMIEQLEEMDEDAVERELLDGDGEDVFGPTIRIETPRSSPDQ